jgi:ribonuclease HI
MLDGETMTIKEAMGKMKQRGLFNVNFKSDSKIIVDAIYFS